MRKVVITLLLALICATMYAQEPIQRSLLGFNLGDSTAQAKAALKARGINKIDEEPDGLYIADVKFAGVDWDFAVVSVYKGRVASVMFLEQSVTPYSNILDRLAKKYADHFLRVDEETNTAIFGDGKTDLSISTDFSTKTVLYYADTKRIDQQHAEEMNEL